MDFFFFVLKMPPALMTVNAENDLWWPLATTTLGNGLTAAHDQPVVFPLTSTKNDLKQ